MTKGLDGLPQTAKIPRWRGVLVATKQFSFRISESAYDFIAREATLEGVTVAQYVRESAFARAWWEMGLRGEDPENVWGALQRARRETKLDK